MLAVAKGAKHDTVPGSQGSAESIPLAAPFHKSAEHPSLCPATPAGAQTEAGSAPARLKRFLRCARSSKSVVTTFAWARGTPLSPHPTEVANVAFRIRPLENHAAAISTSGWRLSGMWRSGPMDYRANAHRAQGKHHPQGYSSSSIGGAQDKHRGRWGLLRKLWKQCHPRQICSLPLRCRQGLELRMPVTGHSLDCQLKCYDTG